MIFSIAGINCIDAQNNYIEISLGMSKYSQTYNSNAGITTSSPKTDISLTNISLGYNYAMTYNWYIGAVVGISQIKGDDLHFGSVVYKPETSLYTFTPKLTYEKALGNSNLYWTPSLYFTFGYGKEDFVAKTDIKYFNYRIGINPLSFDFRITYSLAVNFTLMTPYYNILSASLSDEDSNYDISADNSFIYLGGQFGIKLFF